MTGAPLVERNPLEQTLQSWVGWGAGVAGVGARFQPQVEACNVDTEADCERLLRQQNAANDELCSENGRLRADIERLQAEELQSSATDAEDKAACDVAIDKEAETSFGDELLSSVLEKVVDVLAQWNCKVVEADFAGAVEKVLQETLTELDEADISKNSPTLAPSEETAVLVSEKIALRELVERQQEKIEAMESEFREAGAPLGSALGEALGGAISVTMKRGLSDAGDVLSAGFSAVLAAQKASPAPGKVAVVGMEYEVVGRRGAIVRSAESLRSEVVSELPPGSRLRVTAISEMYPRRVEVVAVCPLAPSGAGEEDSKQVTLPEDTGSVPIIGWISACAKDGGLLIRPAPPEAGSEKPSSTAGRQEESREEGQEEVPCVTLSESEWDCLHKDNEASKRKIEDLSAKLNETGCGLIQSFEMRSVLGELQLGVDRANERLQRLGELSTMAAEEVELRRHDRCLGLMQRQCQVDASTVQPCDHEGGASPSTGSGSVAACAVEEAQEPKRPKKPKAEAALGWDRLMSERETTSAALSVALQRLMSLQKEDEELRAEIVAAEGRTSGELQGLRASLRRLTAPAVAAVSGSLRPLFANSGRGQLEGSSANSHALFQRHLEDLKQSVSTLQVDLHRAEACEAAIRLSLEARTVALRELLRRQAFSELTIPQCGPLRLTASREAQRKALCAAVEEQLFWNLQLRQGIDRGQADADLRDCPDMLYA